MKMIFSLEEGNEKTKNTFKKLPIEINKINYIERIIKGNFEKIIFEGTKSVN